MLEEIAKKAFALAASEESGSEYSESPEKTRAVIEAIGMFDGPPSDACLDLGSEPYTLRLLSESGMEPVGHNLKDGDMHGADFGEGEFGCVFARHVLEHSAFPLYLLLTLHRALEPKGQMVAVVPEPRTEWVLNHPAHVSVLPREQWEKLFVMAGFKISDFKPGTWTKFGHVEWRYLLEKV